MPTTPTDAPHHPSDLWFIDGRAYDLTPFLDAHPGGGAALGVARGSNCSELFRTYHVMRPAPRRRLARYEVEVDRDDPAMAAFLEPVPFTFEEDGFYETVARRVRAHFKETGASPDATPGGRVLAVLGIVLTIVLTVPAFIFGHVWAAVALGLVRGVTSVGPGHGMSHFSLFPRGRWNALVFRMASPFMVSTWPIWTNTHVRSHHVDTLTGEDLQENYPLKRVRPVTEHRAWHRIQHFYIWPIYTLALPLWAMQDLVESLASLRLGRHDHIYPRAQRLENVASIAVNLFLVVVLPFLFLEPLQALAVCVLSNAISSLIVVLQIVVNHEVTDTMGATNGHDRPDWGAHQVRTSHNYGVDSWLALHLSGGLNMQIEHHLFPRIHYRHYPALSGIVREACREFGLPYHTSTGIAEAVWKHYQLLRIHSVPELETLPSVGHGPLDEGPVVLVEGGREG